jgi:hypothetical protein
VVEAEVEDVRRTKQMSKVADQRVEKRTSTHPCIADGQAEEEGGSEID